MAFVIYVPGAAFASNSTVDALFSDVIQSKICRFIFDKSNDPFHPLLI